ncbi:MAG: hypothetical protein LBM78_04860 [Clostridiales bacterium]|jgi:hypothetical protein|nr:hypothetical protein [Clostridiales bacterium]
MQKTEFETWLKKFGGIVDPDQISDNTSRVNRVEKALDVDVDDEFLADRCATVLKELDVKNRVSMREKLALPNDANGLSSLKTAINKYIRFSADQTKIKQ